jgi:hypothetical protein
VLNTLTINSGGTLDINDNAVIVDYTGASPVAAIRSKIIEGRGGAGFGKQWNGTGITSSAAAQANVTAPESRSVGYAENALLPLGRYSTFRGQPVDDTAVLIAYTRTGDANLDGVVSNDDVTIVGANFALGLAKPAWALGDFEYNGFVDNDDVTLLGAFYNPTAAPPPPALAVGWAEAGEAHAGFAAAFVEIAVAEKPAAGAQVLREPLNAVQLHTIETITNRASERSREHLSFFESLAHSGDLFALPRRKRVARWTAIGV